MAKEIESLFEIDEPKIFTPDQKLMALSWKQPFADLMLFGKIETRSWHTNYRGWVLICSSKSGYNSKQLIDISGEYQMTRMQNNTPSDMLCGYAIAIGRLLAVRKMTPFDNDGCFVKWKSGLMCHIYDEVRPIKPFEWKGTQGWKEVSQEIKDKIVFI